MGVLIDLTGNRYGKLTVIEKAEPKGKNIRWICRCDCGNSITVAGGNLKTGHTISCGCAKKNIKPASFEDLTGKKFGHLTVVRYLNPEERKTRQYNWLCRCDCGKEVHANASKLKTGHTVSCGCVIALNKGPNYENLIGKRFEKLKVIQWLGQNERKTNQYNWRCVCDCGKIVDTTANKLKNGYQVSCGCSKRIRIGNLNKKYQYTNKRLYGVYQAMIDRCENPKSKQYYNYGGRGICVCDEWLGEYGYDRFAEWAIQHGYCVNVHGKDCSIDRIDVNGNYTPDNCRWVDRYTQANNRRDNIVIEHEGSVHTLAEWAKIYGINYKKLYWRMFQSKYKRTLSESINELKQTSS